jgi:protein TonB
MAESSLFNNWDSVVAPVRNELVFEDRNKTYGAYDLRKNHNKSVAIALLITGASFLFAVSLPKIIDWITHKMEEVEVPVDITPVDLTAPPPLDETEPPPPPPPPPPVMETVKFTPPVVTDDEVVDEPPPVQTEETPQISTETHEGDGNQDIIIPENTGPAVVEEVVEAPLVIVEQMPEFTGGDAARTKWIQNEIMKRGYPQMEKEAGIQGTVYLTFVVEKDGSITDVKVLRGVSGGPGYDKLALAVTKAMPAWKVGKQNVRAVRVQFNMPIKFSVQ